MTLELLNKDGRQLLEIEVYETSTGHVCKSHITIPYYSNKLLEYIDDYQMKETFIKAMHYFNTISIRFESELNGSSPEEFDRALRLLINSVKEAADMFELTYKED